MERIINPQIVRAIDLKNKACSIGMFMSTPFPYVTAAQEEDDLRALSRRLLKAGLSPSEAGSCIRDAADRIYWFVLRGPTALRFRSWFGKGGFVHQLKDIQIHRNFQLKKDNPRRARV